MNKYLMANMTKMIRHSSEKRSTVLNRENIPLAESMSVKEEGTTIVTRVTEGDTIDPGAEIEEEVALTEGKIIIIHLADVKKKNGEGKTLEEELHHNLTKEVTSLL